MPSIHLAWNLKRIIVQWVGIGKHTIILNSTIEEGEILTWHKISEADGCHGDETEVESIKEAPVILPQHKEASTGRKVQEQEYHSGHCSHGALGGSVHVGQAGWGLRQMWPHFGMQRRHCRGKYVAHRSNHT